MRLLQLGLLLSLASGFAAIIIYITGVSNPSVCMYIWFELLGILLTPKPSVSSTRVYAFVFCVHLNQWSSNFIIFVLVEVLISFRIKRKKRKKCQKLKVESLVARDLIECNDGQMAIISSQMKILKRCYRCRTVSSSVWWAPVCSLLLPWVFSSALTTQHFFFLKFCLMSHHNTMIVSSTCLFPQEIELAFS